MTKIASRGSCLKGLRFNLLRFRKSFAFRSWSTGTCYPALILKIICTIVVVCSLVDTFVMFYEEETSPLPGWGRRRDQHLARKASSVIVGFVAMMTNRARLRHGTPFGADALFGEDIHPFFRTVQADQGHACPTLARRSLCGVAPARQETGVFLTGKRAAKKKKKKKETRKRKRGRKNISFRADCKFRAKESMISEPKSLRPFPFLCAFLSMLRRRRAPSWAFPCVCTLTSLACAACRATLRRFWLSKTDLKTALWAHYFE